LLSFLARARIIIFYYIWRDHRKTRLKVSFFGWPEEKKQNKNTADEQTAHNYRDRKRAKVENQLKPNLLT
jgi:hypothetical protein